MRELESIKSMKKKESIEKIKAILIFTSVLIFASCRDGYQEKIFLESNNIGINLQEVFLEISLSSLNEKDYLLKEEVYDNSSIAPHYGGGFSRILSVNDKEVIQKMYIPTGKNCDTTVVDTISFLFFKVPKRDTSWISFDVEKSQCNNLQLPNRFHFINKLTFNKGDILLEQQAVNNPTYKNFYFFDNKSLAIKKIKYFRGNNVLQFELKNGAKNFFSKLLD